MGSALKATVSRAGASASRTLCILVHGVNRELGKLEERLREAGSVTRQPAAAGAWHGGPRAARDGIETYGLLGTKWRRLVVLERSFHAVARDVERERVFAEVMGFCESLAPQAQWQAQMQAAG